MPDTSHLNALELRLSHERVRLANARTPGESAMRAVWIAGIEREIAAEYKFLGITPLSLDDILMSDDELLAQLK